MLYIQKLNSDKIHLFKEGKSKCLTETKSFARIESYECPVPDISF